MPISRKKFIQLSSLASASVFVPNFLKVFGQTTLPANGNKILVTIQLSGGNDGLNTVVPIRNDIYYRNRQQIGIRADAALKLDDETGLNPALKGLKELYDQGQVCILNGVGYPKPNRSHFRSMEIWQTASGADEQLNSGWLGRYLDAYGNNQYNTKAIEIDDALSLAMKGEELNALAIRDISQFYKATSSPFFKIMASHADSHHGNLAGYLYKTLAVATSSADYLYSQSKIYTTSTKYPDTQLGKKLKTIGSLILSNTDTKVYYASLAGFDTHVNQIDRQNKLLAQLDDALTSFYTDLKVNNKQNDVMIMVFSEFGRRVAENASKGTDHGTANNVWLIGGGLKKAGLYNTIPSLTNLDEGDLVHEIDFRQVYATLLDKWLGVDPGRLITKRFETMAYV